MPKLPKLKPRGADFKGLSKRVTGQGAESAEGRRAEWVWAGKIMVLVFKLPITTYQFQILVLIPMPSSFPRKLALSEAELSSNNTAAFSSARFSSGLSRLWFAGPLITTP